MENSTGNLEDKEEESGCKEGEAGGDGEDSEMNLGFSHAIIDELTQLLWHGIEGFISVGMEH
jgi:hypothetical protein